MGQALIGESRLFVPVLRSAINSHGFANAHRRVGNLAKAQRGAGLFGRLAGDPGLKIAALMTATSTQLRGSRPATSTGLSQAVDEVRCAIHDTAQGRRAWAGRQLSKKAETWLLLWCSCCSADSRCT